VLTHFQKDLFAGRMTHRYPSIAEGLLDFRFVAVSHEFTALKSLRPQREFPPDFIEVALGFLLYRDEVRIRVRPRFRFGDDRHLTGRRFSAGTVYAAITAKPNKNLVFRQRLR
jgi:hypothetical protein